MTPDLPTLRRLHEAATEGPWQAGYEIDGPKMKTRIQTPSTYLHIASTANYHARPAPNHTKWEPNAELIAASRNALPFLLHAADQWAQVQGMRDEIVEILEPPYSSQSAGELLSKLLALIDAPTKE